MSARALVAACTAAAVLPSAGGSAVAAETLVDPMRPPAQYREAERSEPGAVLSPLVLQSIRISSAERTAVISGVAVRPGDRVGAAVVRRIAEAEVVLEQEGVERVLRLYPAVDKRAPAPAAVKPRPRGSETRGGVP